MTWARAIASGSLCALSLGTVEGHSHADEGSPPAPIAEQSDFDQAVEALQAARRRGPLFRRGPQSKDLGVFRRRYGRCDLLQTPPVDEAKTTPVPFKVDLESRRVIAEHDRPSDRRVARSLRKRMDALHACVTDQAAANAQGPYWHVLLDPLAAPQLVNSQRPSPLESPVWPCLQKHLADVLAAGAAPVHVVLVWPPGGIATPGLNRDKIRETIGKNIDDVRFCYEDFANATGDASEVRVAVRFMIGPLGEVLAAQPRNEAASHEALGCCIAWAVQSWTFDPPGGGGYVVIDYPFVLQAR